ncbi:hypothetical protein PPL_11883 [Heterostelium album PN500]|uniref:Uncharacterized protein n=1 Tax=Heterostelium pallidum (strain ATCC 26659 / Pp 5 / PN500) TaxID=670386 RepID=D3BUR1_HETP5|nr:hypothetical protein PPL_11883 [Heterostelium album PN500]EFA74849.1 hypothetical protein PPL_11883 [Heterostelium album PN500]|eukprot:XP_020426983.1 hypothetical protein PPL_11883 [Heterostelium album PN500]
MSVNSQPYVFMDTWAEQKGLFPSEIHLNFCGNEMVTELRRMFAIPDSNMFVTTFVVYTLLQSERIGFIKLNETMMDMAVDAILTYHDKNSDSDSGVYTFWPQVYNQSLGTYTEFPTNLINLVDEYNKFEDPAIWLADLFKKYKIVTDLKAFEQMLDSLQVAFRIPPDSDDTGCNLALGNVIANMAATHPYISKTWQAANPNANKTIETILRYAYRPFSSDVTTSTIDPRTYYVLHEFLEDWTALGNNQDDLVLPGTWLMSLPQQAAYFPYLQMPFNVNNVDLSVSINTLFGLASSIIQNGAQLITQDVERMINSITSLIEWGVNSEIVYKRPDLALLYYPSIYDFSWFISRVVDLLETENQISPNALPPVLYNTLVSLRELMMNNGTNQILSRMQDNGKGGFYWYDFLGNDDTFFGVKEKYGEDLFFSSGLALNVLIDTWTVSSPDSVKRIWRSNTPAAVLAAVDGGVSHVVDNILKSQTQIYNAFFSGSMKGMTSFPYHYPMNFCQYVNGSTCSPTLADPDAIVGAINGVLPHDQYQAMLSMKWMNASVPVNWTSYNPDPFPYWSSSPLTYSINILALSKSLILEESH